MAVPTSLRVLVPPPGPAWAHLATSASREATCAIDVEGGLWCWGVTSITGGPVPGRVDLPGRVELAVVSVDHACAVVDGELWCWGDNDYGQLGRETPAEGTWPPGPVEW